MYTKIKKCTFNKVKMTFKQGFFPQRYLFYHQKAAMFQSQNFITSYTVILY